MTYIINHFYILATIICGVYSQLIMRWQVSQSGALPLDLSGKCLFIFKLLINPWVLSGIIATFLGGITWMLAMSKFEVSYAYPFISLNFILVLILSVVLFNESFSMMKLLGTLLVVVGIIVLSKN